MIVLVLVVLKIYWYCGGGIVIVIVNCGIVDGVVGDCWPIVNLVVLLLLMTVVLGGEPLLLC